MSRYQEWDKVSIHVDPRRTELARQLRPFYGEVFAVTGIKRCQANDLLELSRLDKDGNVKVVLGRVSEDLVKMEYDFG